MQVIIFILVLGLLVFIHELGHFLFAKLFGIRVDEFGFGYPPRILKLFRWKGTDLTLNWIPFGGFVKIFGEDFSEKPLTEAEKKENLVYQAKWKQVLVMLGGIIFNIIFAWVLFSSLYLIGVKAPLNEAPKNYHFQNTDLVISYVSGNSPAELAGLRAGDILKEYYAGDQKKIVEHENVLDIIDFIQKEAPKHKIGFVVYRDGKLKNIQIQARKGDVGGRYLIGVGLERVGKIQLPLHQAFFYGAKNTFAFLKEISFGFVKLISGKISLDAVSGPVGIVKQVGDAAKIGFVYLIGFTAILSLNLAVINVLPFPALDGGRVLFILIEAITRRKIPPKLFMWINLFGFGLLILLMLVVTVKDVLNLF